MPYEDFILDDDTFANEGVARNFAAAAHPGSFLDLDKSSYLRVVADFTAIEIREPENLDVLSQLYVGGDKLERSSCGRHEYDELNGFLSNTHRFNG